MCTFAEYDSWDRNYWEDFISIINNKMYHIEHYDRPWLSRFSSDTLNRWSPELWFLKSANQSVLGQETEPKTAAKGRTISVYVSYSMYLILLMSKLVWWWLPDGWITILIQQVDINKIGMCVRFDWQQIESSGGDINRDEGFSVKSEMGCSRKMGRYVEGL